MLIDTVNTEKIHTKEDPLSNFINCLKVSIALLGLQIPVEKYNKVAKEESIKEEVHAKFEAFLDSKLLRVQDLPGLIDSFVKICLESNSLESNEGKLDERSLRLALDGFILKNIDLENDFVSARIETGAIKKDGKIAVETKIKLLDK